MATTSTRVAEITSAIDELMADRTVPASETLDAMITIVEHAQACVEALRADLDGSSDSK